MDSHDHNTPRIALSHADLDDLERGYPYELPRHLGGAAVALDDSPADVPGATITHLISRAQLEQLRAGTPVPSNGSLLTLWGGLQL